MAVKSHAQSGEKAEATGVKQVTSIYINGAWTPSSGKEVVEVVNPTTGRVIAAVPAGTVEDVDRAVAAAKAAFASWSVTDLAARSKFLRAVADGITARGEEIAAAAASDIGTPVKTGRYMHVKLPASTFMNMADNIEKFQFETREGALAIVREPVGVVGCITPWNYPLHQIAAKVAPALASGCTVVVKPSEVAPLSAYILAEIIDKAGLPPGVFNMVSGLGPVVGEAIASHKDVDMISFTGSVRAGTRVAALAAPDVKRVTLELGGKSPNVVLDDVEDMPKIVQAAISNAFLNSGQTCSALTRLIVPRERMTEVEDLARAAAEAQGLGDPALDETALGPVVSEVQYKRVMGYIKRGIDDGARLVTGGLERPAGLDNGYFVAPTVFSAVAPESVIAQEEIFGPVLVVIPYDTEEEAIEIANGTAYGLSGGVWSGDPARAERVAKRLRTGQVKINGGAFNPVAPFGGYKHSGVGRELGPLGLEEYLETKALTF
ncbi:MAG: aldehyde dehydrogenase family protein [Candidatus Dormibacteraeota bacterium]|nr:aldehyde dehydrogenase family protein [Candidatus Dormibacteraeota bacterium]